MSSFNAPVRDHLWSRLRTHAVRAILIAFGVQGASTAHARTLVHTQNAVQQVLQIPASLIVVG